MEDFNLSNEISEVKKSDFLRWHILSTEEGLWSDMDILYLKSMPNFGNFSGTGSGKTLSAILASKILQSKMTLIICPNDIVDHWEKNIHELFPNDKILIKKDVFKVDYDENQNQYLILNWDTIQQKHLIPEMIKFTKQKIDFIILDEIHFSKITKKKYVSERRKH